MVRRIFVEKKPGFDVEAQGLYQDMKQNLRLQGLTGVRVLNRYDIDHIQDSVYAQAKYTVFAEAAIDRLYEEEMPDDLGSLLFAVAYLPGQYDQRADSAVQCIRMINPESKAEVRFARVIALQGELSEEEMKKVIEYNINPVDSCQVSLEKPETLEMDVTEPEDVKTVTGFTAWTEEELEDYRKAMGFAMSHGDICHVQNYFRDEEKRDPKVTELRVIDTYWSDHCRHTTFQTVLEDVEFEENAYEGLIKEAFDEYMDIRRDVYGDRKKDVCLMDLACIGTKYLKKLDVLHDLDESDEINACSIKVTAVIDGKEEDWLVMFKNETHNHPTEIEPFGGAATCLGGAIRDPLSGRVYVYQAMRVTGAADPRTAIEDTLHGKLPQRKITRGAAHGYSSYGNQIGLATGQVSEIYHPDYVAKRMEVGAVIGAAPADHVRRETPAPGDVIILVGGRTGRDGCGGATGSSKEHTEESILTCGAEVQKGNPPVERNIQRMFRRKEVSTLIKRCNDFGAGGVSVAIGELADSLEVNLDLVPKKYEGLDGTELAISESQERMAVCVAAADAEAFMNYAEEENLESTVVARVCDHGRFKMFWRGQCILDLSRDFLNTNGVKQYATVKVGGTVDAAKLEAPEFTTFEEALGELNCCSQKGLIDRFDSTIGAGTVLMPLGGKYQLTPACGMAAKLPLTEGYTDTTTLMAYGFDPQLSEKSPYHGAMYAVIDSVTKIAAMGGDASKVRLSFQEFFEKLGSDPKKWSRPMMALLGALKVQKELQIPSIGGKDSMSGTFMDISVPPTLISFAVGVTDANQVLSPELKKAGSKLVLVETKKDERGVIDFVEYKENMARVHQLAKEGKILSANTVGKGGLFMAAVKMAIGNKIGARLDDLSKEELLKARYGALVLEMDCSGQKSCCAADSDCCPDHWQVIGETTEEAVICAGGESLNLDDVIDRYCAPLEGVFPVKTEGNEQYEGKTVEVIDFSERNTSKPAIRTAKPKIIIPAFPGTNCEMDSKRAFDRAGGDAEILIVQNQTAAQLNRSIELLAEKIRESQIVMIPGGFSGGDEPDGSAKFITAVFRNPTVSEAVRDLLDRRDGLMLGICNGFQALIKLGLVPTGQIITTDDNSPTLTYNKIGRHQSCLVRTRIASVKSPWLAGTQPGQVFTIPVSHGEGRFIADEATLKALIENGQVATQYVDMDGNPTMDIRYNPNFSAMAIEGITSPDGRVFGKMGHSERIGKNLYKNIVGDYDMQIFESGVKYFK